MCILYKWSLYDNTCTNQLDYVIMLSISKHLRVVLLKMHDKVQKALCEAYVGMLMPRRTTLLMYTHG